MNVPVPDFTESERDPVVALSQERYSPFFYADADPWGNGHDESIDLLRCGLTLRRVQADHEKQSAVDGLIRELCLEQVSSFKPGMLSAIPAP